MFKQDILKKIFFLLKKVSIFVSYLNLSWRNVLTAADDQILDTTDNTTVPSLVDDRL